MLLTFQIPFLLTDVDFDSSTKEDICKIEACPDVIAELKLFVRY